MLVLSSGVKIHLYLKFKEKKIQKIIRDDTGVLVADISFVGFFMNVRSVLITG